MVRLAGPPPRRVPVARHTILTASTQLIRIYNPKYLEPAGFNHSGPRGRFDHHRDSGLPKDDAERGIYYAASSLAGCMVEVFGDTGVIEVEPYRVAVVELARNVILLDLTGDGAWLAGSVAALTKDADREFSQQWARYFYEESRVYGVLDGVAYDNAHNAARAYALFERVRPLRVVGDFALSDPALRGEVATIANELGLILDAPG